MAATAAINRFVNADVGPPVPFEYTTKGAWKQVGDLYSYTTGPSDATRAIVFVYDVFGPSPQCLQGADRLAEHLNVLILVPDYFKGCAIDHEDFMRDRADDHAALEAHMESHGDYPRNVAATLQYVSDAKLKYPLIRSWGAFGLCWGGKVAVLASLAAHNPFRVTGQAHPSRLDAADADSIRTPHICLVSKNEVGSVVDRYEHILRDRQLGQVEVFATMDHGWMGARADLRKRDVQGEYERGYALIAQFFSRYL